MKEKLRRIAAYLATALVVAFGGYIVGTRTAQTVQMPVSSVEVGAQRNAYDSGYDKGLAAGEKLGYESGYAAGREEGYKAGYDAGRSETTVLPGSEAQLGEVPERSAPVQETEATNSENESGAEAPAEEKSGVVYITKTGKKYHRSSCSSLSKSKIEISREEAKQRGYTPCSSCKP